MTTEPRKPGWYWVKFRSETGGDWEALEYMEGEPSVGLEARWFHGSDEIEEWRFESIGPRIPTPDEIDQKDAEFEKQIEDDLARGARFVPRKRKP